MSAEYGTGTIRATFSAAPRRPLVLAAKVIVFGVVDPRRGRARGLRVVLRRPGAPHRAPPRMPASAPRAPCGRLSGTGLYLGVIGLFALGLATIIRHTAGAISAFVGLLLVLPIIIEALPSSLQFDIRRFLPLQIGGVMMSVNTQNGHSFGRGPASSSSASMRRRSW